MQAPTSSQSQATKPQGAIAVSGLSLRHNFAWTLAGNVVYAGCQWGMLIVLAKLGSPVMVGQFALGLAVTAPVIMFSQLALRAVQATDARREYLFGHYLGLRFSTTILALLLIAGITLAGGYRPETTLVILSLGLAKGFESISDVIYGLLQQHERMDRIAVSMMLKGPLSLLALAAGVWLTGSVFWGALGMAGVWGLLLFSYDVRSGALVLATRLPMGKASPGKNIKTKLLRPLWEIGALKSLAWLTLPLGLSMLLISLNSNIPRYFIEHYLGEWELGLFAAMAYLMMAGGMVIGALGQSASPRLAKHYATGNTSAFRTLLLKLLGLGALLGLAGVLVSVVAGREILTLLYRPEYAERLDVFFWLMVATGIGNMGGLLGYGLTAVKYFKAQVPLLTAVTLSCLLSCFWLIPTSGLRGAAIAMVIAMIIQVALTYLILSYALKRFSKNQLYRVTE